MSDISLPTQPPIAPQNPSKAVNINVFQNSTEQDLRATFQAIAQNFNITTPAFYVKLGDLMLSSQSFSPSDFATRFNSLLDQYSQGVVYSGQTNNTAPADLTPDQASIRKTTSPEVPASTTDGKGLKNDFDVPIQDNLPNDSRGAKTDFNVSVDKAASDVLALASRTGTAFTIDTFLYNFIPYWAGSVAVAATSLTGKIVTTANGQPNFANPTGQSLTPTDYVSTLFGIGGGPVGGFSSPLTIFNSAKYFTPEELLYFAVANFYTLPFRKGISIKDLTIGPNIEFNVTIITSKPDFIQAKNKSTSPDVDTDQVFNNKLVEGLSNYLNDINTNSRQSTTNKVVDIDLSNYSTKWNFNFIDNTGNEVTTGLDSLKREMADDRSISAIGSVYIWPVDSNAGSPTIIPFEMNPIIEEGDVAARYQSMQILSRIGDLQSYTGTNSLPISMSTTYYAIKELDSDSGGELDSLSYFSLERLQKIELGYRSLILPFFPKDSDVQTGYRYMRPPLVKIIMGDYHSAETQSPAPYQNLLLYPDAVYNGAFDTVKGNKFRRFKTFICTGIKIDKDPEKFPYYIKDKYIKDMMGFGISMSLIEVAPSYVNALPSFQDLYAAAGLQGV